MGIFDLFRRTTETRQEPILSVAVPQETKKRWIEAGFVSRLTSKWVSLTKPADDEVGRDATAIMARARDLEYNDPYAAHYLDLVVSNVVGNTGVKLKARAIGAKLKPDTKGNDIIESNWKEWGRNATIDNKTWIQALNCMVRSTARDGEIFIILKTGKSYGDYNFQIEFIEADYLDSSYEAELKNKNQIIAGIEYDTSGKRVAYHFWKNHPNSKLHKKNNRIRVEASKVIHLYRPIRAGQKRGLSWLAPVMVTIKHLKEYRKAELTRAQASACVMGTYSRPDGESEYNPDDPEGEIIDKLEPGTNLVLPKGWTYEINETAFPNTGYPAFAQENLKSIATGLGVSYHTLTGDYGGITYSSARQAALEEREFWRYLQQWLIDTALTPIYQAWLEANLLNGKMNIPIDKLDKFKKIEWRPRRWAWVDPTKDINSATVAVNNGFRTRSDVAESLGMDFEELLSEIAREKELMDKYGISLNDKLELIPDGKTQDETHTEE